MEMDINDLILDDEPIEASIDWVYDAKLLKCLTS